MNVKTILLNQHFTLINNKSNLDSTINKLFASDLMSHVMGFAETEDCLVTVLNNINVLGVASLLDFTGVIFSHGVKVNESIIQKANELEIPLLQTKLTTVEVINELHKLGE